MRLAATLALATLLTARPLAGQAAPAGRPIPASLATPARPGQIPPHGGTPPLAATLWPQEQPRVAPLLATGSSLVVPGVGQLMLGQRRWTAYAGVELAGWLVHLDRLRRGRHDRVLYRDLAWAAARGTPNPREESDWAYYEAMGNWVRSGHFDLDEVRGGVQPESDPSSYNGALWSLARDLYLPEGGEPSSPGYAKALAYYEQRAIQPQFVWDWGGRDDSMAMYRDLIHQSDEALRTATVVLGAVVANHLFSAVDAFVSSRLRGAAPARASVAWWPTDDGARLEWRVEVLR
jgi:hypothetical protein